MSHYSTDTPPSRFTSKDVRAKETVQFTPLQLDYLVSLFPPIVFNSNHTETQMRHYFGNQAVIQAVRDKTYGLSKRNHNQDTIPTPE